MSTAAEYAVIGACMLDPDCLDRLDSLHPEDFADLFCRQVFELVRTLHAEGAAIDLLTVHHRAEALHLDIPLSDLGEAVNNTPTAANVSAYARAVRDAANLRRLHATSHRLAEIADGAGTADAKLTQAHSLLASLEERAQAGTLAHAGERLANLVDMLDARVKAGGGITGLPTGFADIDQLTSGLHPGDFIIVAGRPSMGKTAFAMHVAEHVALDKKLPVAVFSLEMPTEQLLERVLSGRARINAQDLRTGNVRRDDWSHITHAMGQINAAPLYLNDTPAISVTALRAMARKLQRERGLSLVMVDYLQLMSGQGENRVNEISDISRGLKALAKELKVPVIALSQLNRSLEQRANKRPVMSDLRESGAIEQDADLILFIYRDEVYDPESEAKGVAEIIIGKQRNGPLGTVNLTFLGEYTRFENYAGPPISTRKIRAPKAWRGGMDD